MRVTNLPELGAVVVSVVSVVSVKTCAAVVVVLDTVVAVMGSCRVHGGVVLDGVVRKTEGGLVVAMKGRKGTLWL